MRRSVETKERLRLFLPRHLHFGLGWRSTAISSSLFFPLIFFIWINDRFSNLILMSSQWSTCCILQVGLYSISHSCLASSTPSIHTDYIESERRFFGIHSLGVGIINHHFCWDRNVESCSASMTTEWTVLRRLPSLSALQLIHGIPICLLQTVLATKYGIILCLLVYWKTLDQTCSVTQVSMFEGYESYSRFYTGTWKWHRAVIVSW